MARANGFVTGRLKKILGKGITSKNYIRPDSEDGALLHELDGYDDCIVTGADPSNFTSSLKLNNTNSPQPTYMYNRKIVRLTAVAAAETPYNEYAVDPENTCIGDIVVIARKVDVGYGWNSCMDKAIGNPAIVTYKRDSRSCDLQVIHPDMSGTYTFGHQCLDTIDSILKDKSLSFKSGDYNYFLKFPVPLTFVYQLSLEDDSSTLRDILNGDRLLILSEDILTKIRERCPRIIGVLLGHNLLEITSLEENHASN